MKRRRKNVTRHLHRHLPYVTFWRVVVIGSLVIFGTLFALTRDLINISQGESSTVLGIHVIK